MWTGNDLQTETEGKIEVGTGTGREIGKEAVQGIETEAWTETVAEIEIEIGPVGEAGTETGGVIATVTEDGEDLHRNRSLSHRQDFDQSNQTNRQIQGQVFEAALTALCHRKNLF